MLSFDFLVIGSGIGGLGFALKAASHGTVAVVCKAAAAETNTNYAQGGISAVTASSDSVAQHIADTLTAGAGHCNEEIVKLIAAQAPHCIQDLQELGVNFTRNANGSLDLGLEGGHSRNRIVHTHDHTGFSVQQALLGAVKKQPNITLLEEHFETDLLLEKTPAGNKKCIGALTFSASNPTLFPILAKAVMLATGGAGQVFQHTTNPAVATGDGIAMAFRAGAAMQDMEFIQFHPTALYDPGKPTFLISEAVRGFGAELKNTAGQAFMKNYHPQGALAPRDVVSRAIQQEMQKSGSDCVFLDLRHLPAEEIKLRFPKIYARCRESNLNMTSDLIPVVPAAHYMCGGVQTNIHGQTTIPGLYACGETACTGLHGANRLASNSLPEAWIFARRAAENAMVLAQKSIALPSEYQLKNQSEYQSETGYQTATKPIAEAMLQQKKEAIQQLMWQYTGIVRTVSGLLFCRHQLEQIQAEIENLVKTAAVSRPLLELRNLAQVALLVVEAALNRRESCGCHFINTSESVSPNMLPASNILNMVGRTAAGLPSMVSVK